MTAKPSDSAQHRSRSERTTLKTAMSPDPEPGDLTTRYYLDLAAAFVRGRVHTPPGLSPEATFRHGTAQGLRLHKFKRSQELPRIRRVFGFLHGLAPTDLLDIGSGRGVFIWPLLDTFPDLQVTATDV